MADAALYANPAKFSDPDVTAKGEKRARVALRELRTLWINTGSLCNITCRNCYIESSPENDRLAYITRAEAAAYLDEIVRDRWPVTEIGFTGGEPFMNPDFIAMLGDALDARLFRSRAHQRHAADAPPARHRRACSTCAMPTATSSPCA